MTTPGTGMPYDMTKGTNRDLFETVCLYVLMAGFAVFTTIVGAVLLLLVEEFGTPLSRGGDFIVSQNTGCLLGILLSGFIIDRYARRNQIFLCYVLFGAVLVSVFFSSTLTAYLILLAFAGFFSKLIDALLNARVSELHAVNKGFYLNLLHCCYGAGSFIGPLYAGTMAETAGGWRASYLLLGGACLVLAILFGVMFVRPGARERIAETERLPVGVSLSALIRRWRVLACGFVLVCYSCHQIGMNNWFPSFMNTTIGVDAVRGGFGLSLFWLGIIAGRFSCSFLTRRIHEKQLLVIGNMLGGLAVLAAAVLKNEFVAFACSAAAGFFSGATIPLVLTLAFTWFPGAQGKVSMLMFSAITIGGMLGPWVMGRLVDGEDLGKGMLFNGAVLIVAAGIAHIIPSGRERAQRG